MIFEILLIWTFVISVFSGLLFGAMSLFGAVIFDFKAIKTQKRLNKHPNNKMYRYRPLLTVIIPAHNEELLIEQGLNSLLRSSYRKFEIIVVDDASTDTTSAVVRRFIAANPRRNIHLITKRQNSGRGAAVDSGLSRAKGELVMTLDADCLVDKYALRNVVRQFADGKTAAVAANVRITDAKNLLSLMQQFDYLIGFRAKKLNTVANAEYMVGGAGATYRRDILNSLQGFDHTMKTEDIEIGLRITRLIGNKVLKVKYGNDVIINTQAVPSYKSLFYQRYRWKFGSLQAMFKHRALLFSTHKNHSKFLTIIRLPLLLWSECLLLLEPLFFSYFAYLAITNQNLTLFAGACLALTCLLLITIFADEHMTVKNKLRLSLYAPIMYILFYVLTYIQVLAAIKCLFNLSSWTGHKKIQGSYVSPERVAHTTA